jgi:prepilin-type processing-associated H-X9-DG protein
VREAANRASCTNNLKQLGLAALNYESAHRGLPFNAITKNNNQLPFIPYEKGTVPTPGNVRGTQGRCSGLVPLLPYVEQSNIMPLYTFNVDWSDPKNAGVLKVSFPLIWCPSSPSSTAMAPAYNTTYIALGNDAFAPPNAPGSGINIYGVKVYQTMNSTSTGWAADYAPLAQVKTLKDANGFPIAAANPLLAAVYTNGPPSAGAMHQNGKTRVAEITDGMSNTTLYSEAGGRNEQYYADRSHGPYDTTKITGPIWADSDNRLTVTGTDPSGKTGIGTGPCVMNCNNLQGDIYSFHPGGANVAFADGSVRFVQESVSIVTLAALVTKSSSELVDPDSY